MPAAKFLVKTGDRTPLSSKNDEENEERDEEKTDYEFVRESNSSARLFAVERREQVGKPALDSRTNLKYASS
ncbi:hypothetical protein SLEP1_g48162 [Rubroshorea leprosula]|uniref:Uncharacterized protein n=1 Tax=Rubroshorea leprosula TaxID=152421 RepID=A0AAV5LTU8_9ROSI|nr:hypothetical protein SLEP1_g48162 [Rubroshorea leprosula]